MDDSMGGRSASSAYFPRPPELDVEFCTTALDPRGWWFHGTRGIGWAFCTKKGWVHFTIFHEIRRSRCIALSHSQHHIQKEGVEISMKPLSLDHTLHT